MPFKIGDLVIIHEQPSDMFIQVKGCSGFLEEIKEHNEIDYGSFVELKENGCGGAGSVPLHCLTLANNDERLLRLKKVRDEKFAKLQRESEARTARYNKLRQEHIQVAMEETGVPREDVETIFDFGVDFAEDWEQLLHGW